jgi:3-deoxy-D-manno-octulosonic-acid transferase
MFRRFLYDGSMLALRGIVRGAGIMHPKAAEMFRGRKNWIADLKSRRPEGKIAWFHCASVGEFEQAKPVIELLKATNSELKIAVTVYSPSGIGPARNYKLVDLVCYLPFDSRKNAETFMDIMRPDLAIFIKYEFWYHFLKIVHERKIPAFSVSAIFRKEQRFFRKNGTFFRSILQCFDHFFVQTQESKMLLESIGLNNVTVTGDTRLDRVKKIAANPLDVPIADAFKSGSRILVIGSSWHQDIDLLIPIVNDESINLKFIIAPHEIGEANIRSITSRLTVPAMLFSNAKPVNISQHRVLIIDNIGLLSSLYRYGELAYIGGAFHAGLHNILEPAAYGIPVIFGQSKSNRKYQEAVDLVANGGAFEISTSDELRLIINKMVEDSDFMKEVSGKVSHYLNSNAGASEKVANHIQEYLK